MTIPSNVTSIGEGAFYGCNELTDVYCYRKAIPETGNETFYDVDTDNATLYVPVSAVQAYSSTAPWSNFGTIVALDEEPIIASDLYYEYDDENLTATVISGEKKYEGDIVIPAAVEHNGFTYAVTEIGREAFQGCEGMTSVDIPNSVTSIGWGAFYGCSGLTSVTIPNSVQSIGFGAFEVSGLTSITIPNSVTSIGLWAFSCSGLTYIQVESGNPVYDSRENCNAIIETASNTLIAGCRNSFIPEGITAIGVAAFAYCYGLTSVTIPEGVNSIYSSAFWNCI